MDRSIDGDVKMTDKEIKCGCFKVVVVCLGVVAACCSVLQCVAV